MTILNACTKKSGNLLKAPHKNSIIEIRFVWKNLQMRWNQNHWDWIFKYHIYPTPPLGQDMTQGQFFKTAFNRFEFRVFLLLDLLPHQGWWIQFALLFTHSWKETNRIHTLLVLCKMQSVSSRIWTRVYFLRQEPLHYGHLNFWINSVLKFRM